MPLTYSNMITTLATTIIMMGICMGVLVACMSDKNKVGCQNLNCKCKK